MDQLLREGNPPTGQLASPKPQYKKPGVDEYAPVEGQHGAPFATLKDASGNIVSPATEATLEQVRALLSGVATENRLEQARVLLNTISTKDFATQTTLEAALTELVNVKSELETIKANQSSGDQIVQLKGRTTEIETIINAQSIAPSGNTAFIQIDFKGCRKATLGVFVNKPWRMEVNSLWTNVGNGAQHLYPDTYSSDQAPVASGNYPREVVMGFRIGSPDAATAITSFVKALEIDELPANVRIKEENRSTTETATATVRIMRIY